MRILYNVIFQVFLFGSLVLFVYTIPDIGLCSFDYNHNLVDIAIVSSLFLILQFIVHSLDFIIRLYRRFFNNEKQLIHFKVFAFAIISGIVWILLLLAFEDNGQCDILIGPADTGISMALLVASIINYLKLKAR